MFPKRLWFYTDDHRSYIGLPFEHESVNHSVGEYVRKQAHTNGVESFWAMLKRGYLRNLPQNQSEALGALCKRVQW